MHSSLAGRPPWAYRLSGFVFALGCTGLAQAQPMTLDQLLERAERYNPRLQAVVADVGRARSGITTARAYPNPEVEVLTGGVRARLPGVTSGRGTSLSVGQAIDLPLQREPRIRAAEARFESATLGLEEARVDLRADVRQAFYGVLQRRAELELLQGNQKLLEETRQRIELSVKVGERARFELVRVDAELANARTQAASARIRVDQALAQLRLLVGGPGAETIDTSGELQSAVAYDSLERLHTLVQERHPALRRARTELRRAEHVLQSERALRVPRPTLFAGVDRDPEQSRALVGVAVPLPVWDRRQGPVGEAVAGLQQSAALVEQQRLQLRSALEASWNRLQVATQQIAAYEGGLIRQAENALRVAESAFRFGERGFLEVLDAQRVLRQVRSDFLNARFDRQAALVEIDRLTARDLTGDPR